MTKKHFIVILNISIKQLRFLIDERYKFPGDSESKGLFLHHIKANALAFCLM